MSRPLDPNEEHGSPFDEPVDQTEEDAVLARISSRNRKRILIPLFILIAICIGLSFVKDPITKTNAQDEPIPTKATAPE